MAGDWNAGLDDPRAMEGLPPAASPLTPNGEDPDEAALRYFTAPQRAQINPMGTATAVMQRGAQAAPMPMPAKVSPSAAAAGASGGAGASPSPYQQTDQATIASERGLADEMARNARQEGDVPANINQAEDKLATDQGQFIDPKSYKPSFGQRVLRGLRGAAIGALTGGVPGMAVGAIEPQDIRGGKGYGAPTDAYDTAVAAHNRELESDTAGLQQAKDDWQRQSDAWKQRQAGLNNAGTITNEALKGSTDAENAASKTAEVPIDQEKADAAMQTADANMQKAFNLSPKGKLQATQSDIDQRTAYANQMKMPPGYIRNRYILTGQFQPAHDATAEEIELAKAEQVFHKEHGRGPQTVAEWQQITSSLKGSGRGGSGAGGAKQENDARMIADDYLQKKKLWVSQYQRNPDGTYSNPSKPEQQPLTPEQFAEKVESFRADGNKLMRTTGYWVNPQGVFEMAPGSDAGAGAGQGQGQNALSVSVPMGNGKSKVYRFKDAASLAKFKQEAGIS